LVYFLGILFILLGVAALAFPFITTIAAKVVLGWLLLIGGIHDGGPADNLSLMRAHQVTPSLAKVPHFLGGVEDLSSTFGAGLDEGWPRRGIQ
jgi:hypothetical protein